MTSVEALDFSGPWPYPWSRLSQLALEAGLEPDELRAHLEREVARAQADETGPKEPLAGEEPTP
jgi:hypothetical protein